MAKRYTRINWKNDATTALGATLLNRMDKGIKDCDDAIGDLALLNTNNKTDLVSAINEQNNKLAIQVVDIKPLINIVNSEYTIERAYATKYGKFVSIDITIVKSSAIVFSETFCLTLPSDIWPNIEVKDVCVVHNEPTHGWGAKSVALCYLSTTGSLLVRDYNNSGCTKAIIRLSYVAK